MGTGDDARERARWARLRFAIIGPLLAAPPAPGELGPRLRELAARTWRDMGSDTAELLLRALGLEPAEARSIARSELPPLPPAPAM